MSKQGASLLQAFRLTGEFTGMDRMNRMAEPE
jgi:hypothetical protein